MRRYRRALGVDIIDFVKVGFPELGLGFGDHVQQVQHAAGPAQRRIDGEIEGEIAFSEKSVQNRIRWTGV